MKAVAKLAMAMILLPLIGVLLYPLYPGLFFPLVAVFALSMFILFVDFVARLLSLYIVFAIRRLEESN